jgi:hypothetical protein
VPQLRVGLFRIDHRVSYDLNIVIKPEKIRDFTFPELWEVFLSWRSSIIEWGLAPKVVFDQVDPVEGLEPIFQWLPDQRYLAIERLLRNPDPDMSLPFTDGYREFLLAMANKMADAGWWSEDFRLDWWANHIKPWLKTFLSDAVAHVPPNYRRNRYWLTH